GVGKDPERPGNPSGAQARPHARGAAVYGELRTDPADGGVSFDSPRRRSRIAVRLTADASRIVDGVIGSGRPWRLRSNSGGRGQEISRWRSSIGRASHL